MSPAAGWLALERAAVRVATLLPASHRPPAPERTPSRRKEPFWEVLPWPLPIRPRPV